MASAEWEPNFLAVISWLQLAWFSLPGELLLHTHMPKQTDRHGWFLTDLRPSQNVGNVQRQHREKRLQHLHMWTLQAGLQRLTLTQISPVLWTVCKCAVARTHSTPTQLKMHLRWKVTGPVHCLGNGRLFCVEGAALQCNDVIRKKGVSSGQTPLRSTLKCICREGDKCCVCRRCKKVACF